MLREPPAPVCTVLLLLLLACTADTDKTLDTDTGTAEPFVPPEGGTISLETRDDVTLAATYAPIDTAGAGIVLLHMDPAGATRLDWPEAVITSLNEAGLAVVAIDRRGAGESEGEARDAVVGDGGRYDVEAAVLRLVADGYTRVSLLGASNGTTSMIDYTAWSRTEDVPEPVALGYLSGGSYTTTNTSMDDIPTLPSLFLYGDGDAVWAENLKGESPAAWQFQLIEGGGHGTALLDRVDRAVTVDALVAHFGVAQ